MDYIAHKADDSRQQSVHEHLLNVSVLAGEFASRFGARDVGELAGVLHDIGKYSQEFQERIRGSGIKVDHSTAGAFEACKLNQLAVAFSVMGHHGGLLDGGGKFDAVDAGTFFARVNKAKQGSLADYGSWKDEVDLPHVDPLKFSSQLDFMFFTRMLYSCLVDADFVDTEAFMQGCMRPLCNGDSIDVLCDRFSAYVSTFKSDTGLDIVRHDILRRCLDSARMEKGLFKLSVPTGGGKTLSSLGFALNHARCHGLDRVIYVVPFTSVIEQNASVFCDVLGGDNVLEHHSNVLYQDERFVRLSENWDVPVVVTTAVQFFESLFSNRVSQCRKLHNIANSVIVFDEVQSLPLSFVRPCVHAMSQLVDNYGSSVLLCTATQPALDEVFREFSPGILARDICSGYDRSVFQRVRFQQVGILSNDDLAKRLKAERQALCVLNSRKSVQDVHDLLDDEGSFALTTLMCPAHRREVLDAVRTRLLQGLSCRVASTSLIEAGVDIDFPVVFKELAGLDSVMQAAGRCNRNCTRPVDDSVVTVFKSESRVPDQLRAFAQVSDVVLSRHDYIVDAVPDYFDELFKLKGKHALDSHGILDMMTHEFMPFKSVSREFKLIGDDTVSVYVPFGHGRELIEQLRSGTRSRELFRELGQYGVSLYRNQAVDFLKSGDIELVDDSVLVLVNESLYSDSVGLSLKPEFAKCYFV